MYIIADAGSTKVQWTLADNGAIINTIYTRGINPIHQSQEEIDAVVKESFDALQGAKIEAIYYYGAGCIGGDVNARVVRSLQTISGLAADKITVESDLMGAARALSQGEPTVACILGTGSNSCYYDGKKIVENVPPLGYILGDEGSGADIGKRLVSAVLKGHTNEGFEKAFFEFAKTDYAGIIERVYRQPEANRFLASFAQFAHAHFEEECVWDIVSESFVAFIDRNLTRYEKLRESRLAFVGGIAYNFRDILTDVVASYGLQIDAIEPTPQRGLVAYHV